MPVIIDTPTTSSNTRQDIVLAGITYTFKYKYNSRDKGIRLFIYLNGEPLILGLKLMPNQLLLTQYLLPNFAHGDLACIRVKGQPDTPLTLGTLGIGREYELMYFTNEEIEGAANSV